MKLYIMTDMEGVAGVSMDKQVSPGNPDYTEACRWLTGEVNAAIAGSFEGGATEIIVNDGHMAGRNIVLEELDPRVKCVFGSPQPRWLPELDSSVDAVFAVAHHAMAGTLGAVRDHTQSSATWYRFVLNGREMGEIGQVAALAGQYGAPVALVTGDDKACAEARKLLKKVETVEVKKGITRECTLTVTPAKARELIRAGAVRAMRRMRDFRPLRLKSPFVATVEYTLSMHADRFKEIPGRKRIGARTIRFSARTLDGLFALIG